MDPIYVFGHKNPDSDTICSALAYAELKRTLGCDAIAVKLGDLNSETKFILKYFNVAEPETLVTIKTQVSDFVVDKPICVPPSTSVRTAWKLMKLYAQKSLDVVDEAGRLVGLATLSDVTRHYMDASDDTLLEKGSTPYTNILETLEATVLSGSLKMRFATGRVLIAAQHYTRLKDYVEMGDIVIANIDQNINEAIMSGASLIICTCGLRPGPKDIEIAQKNNCVMISTDYDTFTAAMLLHQSIPVSYVMTTENIVTVGSDELIDDVKERMTKTRFRSYPVISPEKKVIGMISRYHLLSKRRKQAILVDHNERSQTANGIEDAEIIEIIDHHRLGDIQTNNPILMKNEPLGSTATIIASLYRESGAAIPQKMAGILLSAIISDTLNFKSPTCTEKDIETARELAAAAEVDMGELARKIINTSFTLTGKTPEEIINGDLKEYEVGKYRIGIAQVYSVDSENLSDMRETLLERMEFFCGKNGFSLLMLLVTDLNRNGSEVLFVGERQDIFFKAYSLDNVKESVFLPGVLSRKKQVIPLIMSIEDEL